MKTNNLLICLVFLLISCSEIDVVPTETFQSVRSVSALDVSPRATSLSEDFESGSKASYAEANVTLSSGSWNLSDALLGTLSSDRKNGSQSVRVRNTGSITMNFDVSGTSTVTVTHAVYGSDGSSTWQLLISTNGGSSFSQVGSSITSSSTTLSTASFTISASGSVRFRIAKVSGSSNRINFDDFEVSSSGSGGGDGGTDADDDDNMLFGNPSNATTSTSNANNYLMDKTYYILSYNKSRAIPNWVSWHIDASSLGSADRQDDFRADTSLPSGWYQAGNTSYSGSGFDRGHNCPSADRTSSVTANSETFLMTNMIPQAPNNNRYLWANLESDIRSLVNDGNEAYVIMGNYGTGGTGSNGSASTIDDGNIIVPGHIWKVVLILPQGSNDFNRVTASTRVIAVNTPNNNSVSSDWTNYLTTVNAIEAATGYDLFSDLPNSIEAVLEANVDDGSI